MQLVWSNEQSVPLPKLLSYRFEQLLETARQLEPQMESLEGILSVALIDEETMRRVNRSYRGMDQSTDVLSFALWEDEDGVVIEGIEEDELIEPVGEILICVAVAMQQAEAYGHSLERELAFLFVHGLLHILGYDHEDEQSEQHMLQQQKRLLMEAGIER